MAWWCPLIVAAVWSGALCAAECRDRMWQRRLWDRYYPDFPPLELVTHRSRAERVAGAAFCVYHLPVIWLIIGVAQPKTETALQWWFPYSIIAAAGGGYAGLLALLT
jgi:hypothetical protein